MILRRNGNQLIAIRQTEHARACGRMARAWGAGPFRPPEPPEAVALAAAEHDNGWREWENAPRVDAKTGRPYTYMDIPVADHLAIYRRGVARAMTTDPYAGVLVSLHGSLLYSRYRAGQPGSEEFLADQSALRDRALTVLRRDGRYRPYTTGGWLAHNRDLLAGWDTLSLFLCHGSAWRETIRFPTAPGAAEVDVSVARDGDAWRLAPYPFRRPLPLSLRAVKLCDRRFADDGELRRELEQAAPIELTATLSA